MVPIWAPDQFFSVISFFSPAPLFYSDPSGFWSLDHHPFSHMRLQPWTKPNMSSLILPLGSEALLQRSAQPYRLVLTHGFQPPLDPVPLLHSKMFRLIISSEKKKKKKKAPTLLVLFFPSLAGFIGSRVLPLSQAHLSLLWAILSHSMGHFFVNYYPFLYLLPFLLASKFFHQKSLPSQ